MILHLYMNETLTNAINSRRLHHQLAPMNLLFDTDFDQTIVDGLKIFGHNMVENPSDGGFAAVVGISKIGDEIEASTDIRRGGGIEYFEAEINWWRLFTSTKVHKKNCSLLSSEIYSRLKIQDIHINTRLYVSSARNSNERKYFLSLSFVIWTLTA